MDITIYLPDELAQRAKARADIKLSRMLRDALAARFEEEDAMATAIEGATEIKLTLETEEGSRYTGTITGTRLAGNDHVDVFLTDKENVVVYDLDKLKYYVEGPTDLDVLIGDQGVYLDVMDALGREATIDLGI